jgi:hypothetical protein
MRIDVPNIAEIEMKAQKIAERAKLAETPGALATARRYRVREYVKEELKRRGVRYYQVERAEIERAARALMKGEQYDVKLPPADPAMKYEPPWGFGTAGVLIFSLLRSALLAFVAIALLHERDVFHKLGGLFFAFVALFYTLPVLGWLYEFLRTAHIKLDKFLMAKRKP